MIAQWPRAEIKYSDEIEPGVVLQRRRYKKGLDLNKSRNPTRTCSKILRHLLTPVF